MPNLLTIPAGAPVAHHAAAHLLATLDPLALSRAVVLVPNRRSCAVFRDALMKQLNGKTSLLPRIMPLAESDAGLLSLLGEQAVPLLASIPPPMTEAEQRYLLARQITVFEQRRMGGIALSHALTLADALMKLQEECLRHGVVMTQEKLRQLYHADFATHWQQALEFLGILTDTWPMIEQELGLITAAAREIALSDALAKTWSTNPPDHHVFAVGSTASQPATARLLKIIAELPNGEVILPGLDPTMSESEWASITAGHPLHHLKTLLDAWPVTPSQIKPLATTPRSAWLDILAPTSSIPNWPQTALPHTNHLHLIPCAHAEEEARVISLLLRESLESPTARVALITPDENLMTRVAAHMKRYHITVDRLSAGTLATTETGSLWSILAAAIANPDRVLNIRSLLHHQLLGVDHGLLAGLEKGWRGVNRTRAGNLPRHDAELRNHPHYALAAALVREIHRLSSLRQPASAWVSACSLLLAPWVKASGQGHDAVADELDQLIHADHFGALDAEDFMALLTERLTIKWRGAGLNTDPRIAMLTPVEARLEQFDRVILANMQDTIWPGSTPPNPWLNLVAQQALGLPSPEENISRMAHDVLMLGSGCEVFLTYPKRDEGAPVTRSRFIERLVTLLAAKGIAESSITSTHYLDWANARDASADYAPEPEARPTPPAEQRPRRLPVTDIDKLFTDPFTIYAKHVLGLRQLDDIDAAPEASDFGSLTHKAIEELTRHWNREARPATQAELDHIANHALRDFSERPNVDIFWRTRLLGGLHYVNRLEAERRPLTVLHEETVEGALADITLHGRIDRIEQREGRTTIIDYKTGNIPTEKKILEGHALQLLAYAILLGNAEAIEYWALPKLGDNGEVRHVETGQGLLSEMEQRLKAALEQMLDEKTPFLAIASDDIFGNEYSGISRYDEWAG